MNTSADPYSGHTLIHSSKCQNNAKDFTFGYLTNLKRGTGPLPGSAVTERGGGSLEAYTGLAQKWSIFFFKKSYYISLIMRDSEQKNTDCGPRESEKGKICFMTII